MNLSGRHDLARYLNDNSLLGEGVEIGVDEGLFAAEILNTWNGSLLYGIDPYIDYPVDEWRDGPHFFPDRSEAFRRTSNLLGKYGGRHRLIRESSEDAVSRFNNNTLDFVYIDSNHGFKSVQFDIAAWWPKIKPGGLMGGHDYYCRSSLFQLCEVPQAVGEFCQKMNIIEHITSCKSWWITKP